MLVGHFYIIAVQMSIQAGYLIYFVVVVEFIAMSQHLDTREQLVTSQ